MTFDECTAYLDHMPRITGEPTLEPMRHAFAELVKTHGDYHPLIIHVAGTNGKGSTCAMLERIFREKGFKTGLYISPHLIDYTERIRVNGENISHEDFARLVTEADNLCKRLKSANDELRAGEELRFCPFDLMTIAALLYFAETGTDLIVLETGMGGRYDATTALCEVFRPIVTAITSISLDHMAVLGNTIEKIAQNKAGIILPGVPIVLAKNQATVSRVVRHVARQQNAPYIFAGELPKEDEDLYEALSLKGRFQKDNLALVLGILSVMPFEVSREDIKKALQNVSWPARQQAVESDGARFIIDGAHNRDAFIRLLEDANNAPAPKTLLFGMLGRKDVDGVIGVLSKAQCFDKILYTSFGAKEPCAEFEAFCQKMRQEGFAAPIEDAGDLEQALQTAKTYSLQHSATIWCAGSLYLAGEILKALGKDGTHC